MQASIKSGLKRALQNAFDVLDAMRTTVEWEDVVGKR